MSELTVPPPVRTPQYSRINHAEESEFPTRPLDNNNHEQLPSTYVRHSPTQLNHSEGAPNGGYGRSEGDGTNSTNSDRTREASRAPLVRRGDPGNESGQTTEQDSGHGEKQQQARGNEMSWIRRLARHFIGIRDEHSFESPLLRPIRLLPPPVETYLSAFLGSFIALLGVCGISYSFKDVQGFEGNTPLAIASLGASAVLLYLLPDAPLSQPRNVIGGHIVSALTGAIISQLFSLDDRFETPPTQDNTTVRDNSWHTLLPLSIALSVAVSVIAMHATKTVHPPAGGTAVIAAAHRNVNARWTFLLDIFIASLWMTLWSFFLNNLGRKKYPKFWWTPAEPKKEKKGDPILPTTKPPSEKPKQ